MNRCSECQNRHECLQSETESDDSPPFWNSWRWKFTDYLNTDLAIPRRAHKRFKIRDKNKNKKPRKKGANKKKTKIHLLRLEPPNPRARQVHDQRTVGQRQSVSACGCCFNFVEYIAVKKEWMNQKRKKKEGKKTGFVAGIEPSTIGSMRLLLTNCVIRLWFSSYFKAVGPNRLHFLCKILQPSKYIAKSIFFKQLFR